MDVLRSGLEFRHGLAGPSPGARGPRRWLATLAGGLAGPIPASQVSERASVQVDHWAPGLVSGANRQRSRRTEKNGQTRVKRMAVKIFLLKIIMMKLH